MRTCQGAGAQREATDDEEASKLGHGSHDALLGAGALNERIARTLPGIPMLLGLIAALVATVVALVWWIGAVVVPAGDSVGALEMVPFFGLMVVLIVVGVALAGLTPVNPNEARARAVRP